MDISNNAIMAIDGKKEDVMELVNQPSMSDFSTTP